MMRLKLTQRSNSLAYPTLAMFLAFSGCSATTDGGGDNINAGSDTGESGSSTTTTTTQVSTSSTTGDSDTSTTTTTSDDATTSDTSGSETGAGDESGSDTGSDSGSGTGADTDGDVCAPSDTDEACVTCTKDACCDEIIACLDQEDCRCFLDCAEDGTPLACIITCNTLMVSEFTDLLDCTSSNCEGDCPLSSS